MTPLLLLRQASRQRKYRQRLLKKLRELKYSPDQPRDPAGSPTGGQWTDGEGNSGSSEGDNTSNEMSVFEALYDYQNYAYGKINASLREGKELDEKGKQYVRALDKAFEQTPITGIRVWRGDGAGISATLFEHDPLPQNFNVDLYNLNTSKGQEAVQLLNEKYVGKVFSDKAYVSTATSQRVVLDKFVFGSLNVSRFGAVGLIEITGKSKAIDMDKMTGRTTKEKERLLPRTTSFNIERVDIKPHPDGERVYLHWKVKIQQ
jgi:hypothetical protein